jgi:DNA-binding winged helix-turn-helix (wHTH) protein
LEASRLSYQFGEFTLDIARGCVLRAGVEIKLRPKVYETLKYLVQHPGQLIGKQELMQAVWPNAFVTDDSLVQCTLELRQALDDGRQQLLKTVPRRGYRLRRSPSTKGYGKISAGEWLRPHLLRDPSGKKKTRSFDQ